MAAATRGLEIAARIRSSGPPQIAEFCLADGVPAIRFPGSVFGVSPGQACVFYADASGASQVLGGGWIKSAERQMLAAAE